MIPQDRREELRMNQPLLGGQSTQSLALHADRGAAGPMTRRLTELYKALAARETVRG